MAIRRVIEYPNPVLRVKAETVIKITHKIHDLVRDLLDTMYSFPGCVGLAANQIGAPEKIAVIDVTQKQPGGRKLVMINPEVLEYTGEKFLREGCLSVQNLTANVKRAEQIVVQWTDINGGVQVHKASGIEAICIQHEMDHLNGLLFIDRVVNAQTDIFRRKKYLH